MKMMYFGGMPPVSTFNLGEDRELLHPNGYFFNCLLIAFSVGSHGR